MKTEIFYYSGTGFSLKAVKMIAMQLEGEVKITPIVGAMKESKKRSDAARIGFVFPMHAFGLPNFAVEFLKSYNFGTPEYTFALITRGGAPTRMHKEMEKMLKPHGLKLNAFAYATAPNTFDTVFKIHKQPDPEVQKAQECFEEDIAAFAKRIANKETFYDLGYRDRFSEYIMFPFMRWLSKRTRYFSLEKDFYTDERCTSCGMCENMCLSGKIKMQEGRPYWQDDVSCQFCLACLQLCPAKAIQVKETKSHEEDRIYEKNVDRSEIAAQKIVSK